MNKLIVGIVIFSTVTGCTGSGGSDSGPSSLQPVKEIVGDIIGTTPADVKSAQKEVQNLQQQLNQDPNYEILNEDQELLLSESLIDDASEIKGWVK
jgi:hypothetical protein